MPRLFFALELPLPIRQQLTRLQTPLSGARWQSEQNLHLTISFLGQQPAEYITELQRIINRLPIPTFELTVQGAGCFGSPTRARVLWAGIASNSHLESLKQYVDESLLKAGLSLEDRPFRPHITLARFPRASGHVETFLVQHQAFTVNFTAQYLSLFESSPGRAGPHYEVLWRAPLKSKE